MSVSAAAQPTIPTEASGRELRRELMVNTRFVVKSQLHLFYYRAFVSRLLYNLHLRT